jgi:hypothetical protein
MAHDGDLVCARRDANAVGPVEYVDWGTPTSLSEVSAKPTG